MNDGTNDSAPAEIAITITPVDDAPLVAAGADQLIILPTNSVQLAGSVTYDVFPETVDFVQWTRLSGPGTVTFSNPTNESTTAVFSRSGIYELRLTASDSVLTGSDDLIITIDAPPIVDAGSNQTNTLPASVTLNGFAGDDDVPTNGALAVSWSKVSGAGSVIFANPNATNTTATFSDSGVYVLRLTADDGIVSTSSEVTVLVNRAPVVDAGSSQSTTNLQITLDGTAFDDGLPGAVPLSIAWTEVSGPGTVNFSNPASAATTASFSVGGVYELRLTADDGIATNSATVIISINQAPIVSAGPDALAVVGHDILLQGSMSDDGLPNGSLSAAWSVVSGPGAVTIITSNSPITRNRIRYRRHLCSAVDCERFRDCGQRRRDHHRHAAQSGAGRQCRAEAIGHAAIERESGWFDLGRRIAGGRFRGRHVVESQRAGRSFLRASRFRRHVGLVHSTRRLRFAPGSERHGVEQLRRSSSKSPHAGNEPGAGGECRIRQSHRPDERRGAGWIRERRRLAARRLGDGGLESRFRSGHSGVRQQQSDQCSRDVQCGRHLRAAIDGK